MAPEALIERVVGASGFFLLVIGLAGALLSTNLSKRLVGLVFALMGAVVVGLALAGPGAALTAGIVVALAYLLVGASLLVRLQEAHRNLEASAVDAADAASERVEVAP